MTFWLDANLHPELATWLGSQFKVTVKSLKELDLWDADDRQLFEAARRFNEIVIVTKDEDFVELIERLGTPPQVVWLTTGNATKLELQAILKTSFDEVLARLKAGAPVVEVSR